MLTFVSESDCVVLLVSILFYGSHMMPELKLFNLKTRNDLQVTAGIKFALITKLFNSYTFVQSACEVLFTLPVLLLWYFTNSNVIFFD